jgi:glycosyltransferase
MLSTKKEAIEITIITVVKNNVKGIVKTLDSINSQSFMNYEHIIIDSNSTDGTSEVIKEKINNKSIYFREHDDGMYEAINNGIKKANGKYIGLLHSGDVYSSKETLSLVFKTLDPYDLDFVFGNIAYFKFNKIVRLWKFNIFKPNNLNPFKIAHTSLFIKRKIIKDLNFYSQKFKISSDLDFLIKLCKNKLNFYKIDDYLIYMESGGLSFSLSNYLKKIKEDFSILKNHYSFFCLFIYIYKVLIKFNGYFFIFKNSEIKNVQDQFTALVKNNKLFVKN